MGWSHLLLLSSFAGFFVFSNGQPGNQPPTWVASSYSILTQGISESTPVGTSLCKLKCNDKEGDTVVYSLQTGKAVRVLSDGTVILAYQLDAEQRDTVGYSLTFVCGDIYPDGSYRHPQLVVANVEISVNDANDNPPVFQVDNPNGYAFYIHENAAINTVVETSIKTVDIDRTVNAELKTMYLICNSPNATERSNLPESSKAMCEKFRLNYTQIGEGIYRAIVTLIDALDYETRPVYTSKIVAIDGPGLAVSFTSTVNIQINILDDQDMPPLFTNPGETASVSEAAAVGSTVMNFGISARDGDTGDRRAIALTIVDDPKNAFNLTTPVEATPGQGIYTSMLIIRNQLDRETNPGAYMFVVMATELDGNKSRTDASATATYSVFVSDINDNAPTFVQTLYVVNVTEIDSNVNASASSMQITGLHINCYDRDEPSNARYTVTIVQQTIGVGPNAKNVTDAYSISPDFQNFTGNASLFLKVENAVYLDYDNPDYRIHTVVLVAREQGTKEMFSGSTTVSLYIQDLNDNAPVFTRSASSVNVSENTVPPVVLLTVNATDKDSGANGQVRYTLEESVAGVFSIDSVTGQLSLIAQLDYETTTEYLFLVFATDQAADSRSSQTQVTVTVLNYNDMPPRFRQSQYQTAVNESSLLFQNPITVQAVDNEAGSNNITYRIISGQSSNNAFVLNPVTGELTLRSFLDFADTPKNANGNNTGVFILVIEASDNGQPPLTNTANVLVSVIDENNHPPVLDPTNYYAVLYETAKEGTPVVRIIGNDSDAGDNGKLTFRLGEGSTDNFAVDDVTGWVKVGPAPFDYDVQNYYRLIIIVTDGGAPQKSATAFVFVNITDSNNKDPSFAEVLYLLNVDDRNATGTVIRTIPATDPDKTASLEYSIMTNTIIGRNPDNNAITSTSPYDYTQAFGVNANGGIYIKNKLDHNIMAETTFSLLVRDKNTEVGTGTATTQITIIIRGEVVQRITFDTVSQVFMNEDARPGYSPLTVTARDVNNQPVHNYQKVNGSAYFTVDSYSGRVSLVREIDYENDTAPNHLHVVVIVAYSANNQQSATASVSINIVDVNDNNPVFQQTSYTAEVSETALYPTTVVTIFATDADSKSYGPLGFSLTGFDSDDFTIFADPLSSGPQTSRRGQVIVAQGKKLDYNRRSQYELTLIVGDNEMMAATSIRLFGIAQLIINVIDENNNSPEFKESRRSLSIAETAEIGESIATIYATDADKGPNGDIVFTLEQDPKAPSVSGLQLFSIGQVSGIVSVAQSLIGHGNQQFNFLVRAQDRGDVPNYTTMELSIKVISTEQNDGNPQWFYPPMDHTVYVPENVNNYTIRDPYNSNNTAFFDVTPRTGPNVTFALSPYSEGYSKFSISAKGEITVITALDREEKDTYQLIVIAKDSLDPVNHTSARQLLVVVLDVNDNNATYTNPKNYPACHAIDRPLHLYVKENSGINVSVANVTACDPDTPENAAIIYELYNGNEYCYRSNRMSAFRLDSNGQLITLRNIDYEQDKEFNMCVLATSVKPVIFSRKKRSFDMNQMENITNVAYINIMILDANDNGPKFTTPTAVGIVQTVPGNGPVLTLSAIDPDGPSNSVTSYRIETSVYYPPGDEPSSPFSGAFNFRDNKGVLYATMPSYQGYSGGRFVLKVVATDSLNSSFSDSQTVTIYVYERGQAVKVILNQKPADGSKYGSYIVSELDQVSSTYQFLFLRVSEHITEKSYDLSKTDVCFLAVDSTSKNILNIRQVVNLLSESRYQNILRRREYLFIDEGQCFPTASSESSIKWRDLWWVLVAVAIFIFVCCVILIILVCILYDRYKRYMETRKTYLISQ
ncbi:hypothetical protein BsWGS_06399 [Bradybaena similaris]